MLVRNARLKGNTLLYELARKFAILRKFGVKSVNADSKVILLLNTLMHFLKDFRDVELIL